MEVKEENENKMEPKLQSIKDDYLSASISLLHVVEQLKAYLTNDESCERAVGTKFLGDLLECVSSDKLSSDEIKFMSSFMVDRLSDHHKVVPLAIYAMFGLLKQKNALKDDVKFILKGIFKEVHCQCLLMTDRRLLYSLFKFCLLNRLEDVAEIQAEFTLAFITSMDGEKDPRNLALLFSFIPFLAQNLVFENYTEDLFEVFAAYFPIDFHPPVDDPYGISSDDLLLGLRSCFASTSLFAPFAIPLIQEKIESDLLSAKIDALLTLQTCCQNYTGESVRPFLLTLWPVLRQEVIEGRNEEVESETLKTIESIVECVEREPTTQTTKDTINKLGEQVMRECLGHLINPENRLMFVSSNLLLAVSKNSLIIFNMVFQKVMVILMEQWSLRSEPSARKNILIVMSKFIESARKFSSNLNDSHSSFEAFYCCIDSSLNDASDASALKSSLDVLSNVSYSMTEQRVTNFAIKIIKIILHTSDLNVRDSALLSLKCLADANEFVLKVEVIPMIIDSINKDESSMENSLTILSKIASKPSEVTLVMNYLWDCVECSKNNERTNLYIQCIANIVSGTNIDSSSLQYLSKEMNILKNSSCLCSKIISSESINDTSLNILRYLSIIIQYVSRWEEESAINYILQDVMSFCSNNDIESQYLVFTCIDSTTTWATSCLANYYKIYHLEGLLLSHPIPSSLCSQILSALVNWSLHATDKRVREDACLLFSSIINRSPEDMIDPFLANFEVAFSKKLKKSDDPGQDFSSFIIILGWIVKALIMRRHSQDAHWMEKLESLLHNPSYGPQAAQCFCILLQDFPRHFSTEFGAKVGFLYKQRIFESRIGFLVKLFSNFKTDGKFNVLLAISHLMKYVPSVVLSRHVEKLIPVICQGLTSPPIPVTVSCVSTLAQLLKDSCKIEDGVKPSDPISSCIAEHMETFVKRLIQLSVEGSIEVRLKSLECLECLSHLPTIVTVPYKEEVIRGLRSGLGDRKRVVRRQATAAKHSWVMGQDG